MLKYLVFAGLLCLGTPAFAGGGSFLAPMTSGSPTEASAATLGTTATQLLAADGLRGFLLIANTSASNSMTCSFDGSTPVTNGNGVAIPAQGNLKFDTFVPNGPITCVGSAASTAYTLVYVP